MPPSAEGTARPMAPVERLPAELIERILLHVVNDESPTTEPTDGFHEDTTPQRVVGQILGFRLTSRTFRDMSWRALAEVLGATIYDLHSMTSMSNLDAMSNCARLQPWISKINITCAPLYYPSRDAVGNPVVFARQDLIDKATTHIKEEDKLLSSWPLLVEAGSVTPHLQSYEFRCEALQETLAHLLTCFKNLESANFVYYGAEMPKRYEGIIDGNTIFRLYDTCHPAARNAWQAHVRTGQKLFLYALAASKARPRSLHLVANFTGLHSFVSDASETVLVNVCNGVQNLSLSDDSSISGAWWEKSWDPPKIILTRNLFPDPRSLTVSFSGTPSLPAGSRLPMLSVLTAKVSTLPDARLFRHFMDKVRHLELQLPEDRPIQEVFQAIAVLALKTLTLVWLTTDFFEQVDSGNVPFDWYDLLSMWKGIPLLSTAETVIVRPERFSQMYRQHPAAR